jgi:hypothetical protein
VPRERQPRPVFVPKATWVLDETKLVSSNWILTNERLELTINRTTPYLGRVAGSAYKQ